MKKIASFAAISAVIAIAAGACTVETGTTTGSGGTAGTTGSGGTAGSTTTAGTAGTGTAGTAGTAGTGGSAGTGGTGTDSGTDGGVCAFDTTATACKACAEEKCSAKHCACVGLASCKAVLDEFYGCLRDGSDLTDCAVVFVSNMTGNGAELANDLAECIDDQGCVDRCHVADGGGRD